MSGLATIFGGGGAPKIPAPPPPAPMPDPLDPAILAAKRRTIETASATGRASTILSGGDQYSTDKLGVK